jgi:predicted ATPase
VTESPYDRAVELVEREPHLAALAEHLAAAAAGEGRLVLVAGEAGIGKTTLLRVFANEHAGKTRIAWGACDGLDSPNRYGLPPFYALHAWAWKVNPSGDFFAWNPRVDC